MLTVAGWAVALAVGVWLLRLRFVLGSRMELVARACHELRRPLTVARLGIELVNRDREPRAEALTAIDLELASAGVALDDLGSALAGRLGPTTLETVDISALLSDLHKAFRPLAQARGVDLGLRWRGGPATVHADRIRLAQATGNLVANAIEHGRGKVELQAGADPDHLEIEVTDDGPGLPAPLTQFTARTRKGRGSRGRGLAIAADVASRHGGHLAASSDGGSRLALSLPLRKG
ncbi:MAG: two-component system, OmpR family, sensor kinase [Solirubrobacteraceae bacterium]|jgi:signal transduction histidine kinase|nr:two-component system, OmpR family, sensor kinase [Solirubrobacteraceae bacterium]